MQKFYTLEMKDELNMENLIYQLESTYSASLSQLNAGFWKGKYYFSIWKLMNPVKPIKNQCSMNKSRKHV